MSSDKPINPHKMVWAEKGDLEIAKMVGELTGTEPEQEKIRAAGRDRIEYLSQRVTRLERALLDIENCPFDIEGFPSAAEAAGWMNDRATEALDIPVT